MVSSLNKKPRYIVDLLFNEETIPKTYEPNEWHDELDKFIDDQIQKDPLK